MMASLICGTKYFTYLFLLMYCTASITTIKAWRRPRGNQTTTTATPPVNVTIDSRIVGGSLASEGQFPYQAVLYRNSRAMCGGSLITSTYVLTAAHCVLENGGRGGRIPVFQLTVRLGTTRLFAGGQIVPVAETKVHPSYTFLIFDLALIRMARSVTFSNFIRPIRPTNRHVNPGTQVTVSGFGATRTGGGMEDRLRYILLTALNDQQCFSRTRFSPSVFCLGHPEGRGICQGDSGGPAVWGGSLIGAMSFTLGRCGTTAPDGFAKISFMYDWVLQNSR